MRRYTDVGRRQDEIIDAVLAVLSKQRYAMNSVVALLSAQMHTLRDNTQRDPTPVWKNVLLPNPQGRCSRVDCLLRRRRVGRDIGRFPVMIKHLPYPRVVAIKVRLVRMGSCFQLTLDLF